MKILLMKTPKYFTLVLLLLFISEILQAQDQDQPTSQPSSTDDLIGNFDLQECPNALTKKMSEILKEPTDSMISTTSVAVQLRRRNSFFSNLVLFFTGRQTQYDEPVLIDAVLEGQLEYVTYLVTKGANVDIRDTNEYIFSYQKKLSSKETHPMHNLEKDDRETARLPSKTPLMYTVEKNDIEMVRLLLEYNAEVNLQNEYGWTAFMIAIFYDHIDIAKILIESGADIEIRDRKENRTIFMIVSHHGNMKMVEFLINELKVDINARDNNGWTAYMLARFEGHLEVVDFLESLGSDEVELTEEDYQFLMEAEKQPSFNHNTNS